MASEKILNQYKLVTSYKKLLADTVTPVSIYLKLRDRFANSLLLESSDYHGNENSFSYICCQPLATFCLKDRHLEKKYPDGSTESFTLQNRSQAVELLSEFATAFHTETLDFKFINNGLFGYMCYDAVQYFEDIELNPQKEAPFSIPEIMYGVYKFVIVIDHFKNELYVFHHSLEGESSDNGIDQIITLISNKSYPSYDFLSRESESSNLTDEEFLKILNKGIKHCNRGDVFQIVLSRQYNRPFQGDEFNVYRSLRSVNPSPYLFYFDYGSYKIFGSSPEAQLVIKNGQASIFPIAGTFRRTGDDKADAELAEKLLEDPKENSEHVMLVDLARNDISRNGENVKVEIFKEIQYYSHVIHLVSKVTGMLSPDISPIQMVADTFPAGTLSGAPKYRALELIDKYEPTKRGYYGGAIGFMGFNGDFNHAIMIRSFLSAGNKLYYQAGAGVVAKSTPENELQEVHHKLAALRCAIELAEEL